MTFGAQPEWSTEQLEAHIRSQQLRAWSHTTTVRIARLRDNSEYDFNAASGVLVEFPSRAIIATAWHVLEQFRTLRDGGEDVRLICDNMTIAEPCTVFRDESADIAFVDLPATGRQGISAVPYRPKRLWPPPPVMTDDQVLLCGFPKRLRTDGEEILFGDLTLLASVTSASERHFMLQIDYDTMLSVGRVEFPRKHVDFGGVSGGPVFLSDAEANPLVGIISQAASNLPLWRIASLANVPSDVEFFPSEPV